MTRGLSYVQCNLPGPLGQLLVAASPLGLAGVWFEGQRHGPSAEQVALWPVQPDNPFLQQAAAQLKAYWAGAAAAFDVRLDLSAGTPFQQAVWQSLQHIPRTRVWTYAQVAQHAGYPRAARAVGAAIGRNPLGIVVPCHRVVGSDGSLTGYAGGLSRKSALLALEGALV